MKQNVIRVISAALCNFVLFPMSAVCASDGDRLGIFTLGEVVVTGSAPGVETTQTVHTVTAEDIRNRGAKTLDQAIALLPGVNVRTGGEGIPRIDIRGFRTRHVVLLLDGIPMNSSFDQQFDPTVIPTENISEIKLTAGANSVLYGQGGLGGVINIITRKGAGGVQGMLAAETGNHAPYLGRAAVSGAADRFNYFVSGSAAKIDGFPLSDRFGATTEQGKGYRKNSDKESNNVFGSISFTPGKDLALGVTVNYTQGSFGKPGSVISDPFDPFAAAPKYVRVDEYAGVSAQLAVDYSFTNKLSLRGWTFINHHDEDVRQYDNAGFNSFNLAAGSFQQHVTTDIFGITLQPRYEMGNAGTVSLSLAAEGDLWRNSGPLTIAANTFAPQTANRSLGLYSAGVEYELSPLPGLGLVVGYGHYLQARNERNENDYSLLAGASYDISQETRLKASFKRNVRFPSLGDLYDLSQGNSGLTAERSYTYEAGVEQKLPFNTRVSLTGFYTEARNLIQNDQATSRSTNLAEIRFAGVEVSAATRFLQNLFLRASYSYLGSEDRSRAGRDQQQYTPGNKATMEGLYDFACGFTPYASLLYVGDQFFYTKNNITPVQKAQLNDYLLVNVKLSQKLLDNRLTLSVGVNNLLDENYESSYGLPRAGRFVYGGVEIHI